MTKQEIDQERDRHALGLLCRAGVGYVLVTTLLPPDYMEKVTALGNAGSPTEALVKVALQYALLDHERFRMFIDMETATDPQDRNFRAKR